jgi:cardiolipin synthase
VSRAGTPALTPSLTIVPNLVSLLRAAAAPRSVRARPPPPPPLIVWLLLSERETQAFWLFLVAGLTDLVDGWLAERLQARSEFGARLDPLADKILVGAVYLALGWLGQIPLWLVALVVTRDLMIMAGIGVLLACRRPVRARPILVSKINTGLQLLLVLVVLATHALPVPQGLCATLTTALVVAAAATTLASWIAYGLEWMRLMAAGVGETP